MKTKDYNDVMQSEWISKKSLMFFLLEPNKVLVRPTSTKPNSIGLGNF